MFRSLLLCLVCVSVLLSACSAPAAPASTAAPAEGVSGKITFLVSADPQEEAAFKQLADAYKQKYPQVAVDVVNVPGEEQYKERLITDIASGATADVILFDYEQLAQFNAKNAFEPLDAYLAKSQTLRASDFYPQALSPFVWQGKQMCVPLNVSSDVVYYNKALFDAARVAYPQAGWTWDDFLKDAQALTRAGGTQFGAAMAPEIGQLAPFIWQNGVELVDKPGKPTRLALDTPAALAALQWVFDWQLKYHIVPDKQQESAQDSRSRFLAGTTAMLFSSRKLTASMRATAKFDWDVAPLPKGKQAATVLHSDGYCIPTGSKNKDAAWSFVAYANSVDGQTLLAKTGRTVPSRQDVAESAAFLDPSAKPQNARAWLDQIPAVHALPLISTWGEIEEKAGEELDRGFFGEAPVDEAVKDAVEQSNAAVQDGVTP